jgi:hypothetical protein
MSSLDHLVGKLLGGGSLKPDQDAPLWATAQAQAAAVLGATL